MRFGEITARGVNTMPDGSKSYNVWIGEWMIAAHYYERERVLIARQDCKEFLSEIYDALSDKYGEDLVRECSVGFLTNV